MKRYNFSLIIFLIVLFNSCDDFLGFEKPALTTIEDAFLTPMDAIKSATAAYAPLTWEYGETFFPEWWIGDVCSDDAIKGGSTLSDMDLVYDMENFKTKSDNTVLLAFYRAQYMGIFRCNLVIENVPKMDSEIFADESPGLQDRVTGEALFLRSLYYFRLVRVFGGVPIVKDIIKYQADWKRPRSMAEEVYDLIFNDLKTAIQYLPERSEYNAEDLGRATKGAARALLMKAYMNNHNYEAAKLQADSIIASAEYTLVSNYADIFSLDGENGSESIFEIQYIQESTSDAWGGLGFSRGTLTPTMTRPRWSSEEGWGFNRPSQELYDEFEPGDPRREVAIYAPTLEQVEASDDNTMNINVYLGNRYTARKYSMMNPDTTWISLGHATRGAINRKEIRYADVLLMYAEACCKIASPDINKAKWALEEVRSRARKGDASILPAFPYGTYADTPDDLYKAIQHERRVELAMEGHRWFDLARWGVLDVVMNNYRQTTKPQIAEHMSEFIKGKHELFPIPLEERDLNSPMSQNPGYDGVPIQ